MSVDIIIHIKICTWAGSCTWVQTFSTWYSIMSIHPTHIFLKLSPSSPSSASYPIMSHCPQARLNNAKKGTPLYLTGHNCLQCHSAAPGGDAYCNLKLILFAVCNPIAVIKFATAWGREMSNLLLLQGRGVWVE